MLWLVQCPLCIHGNRNMSSEHLCFAILFSLLSFAFYLETVQLRQLWFSPSLCAFKGSKVSRARWVTHSSKVWQLPSL